MLEIETIRTTDKYDPETVDTALLMLALNAGAWKQTVNDLKAGGIEVPESTLKRWVDSYPNRYRWHAAENLPKIEERYVAGILPVLQKARDVALQALEVEEKRLKAGETRDASGAARNAATVGGILTQRMMELQGRNKVIVEHKSPEDVLRRLAEIAPGLVRPQIVQGTAEEVE